MGITDVQRGIAAVLPLVHDHAGAAERDGRLPDEVVDDLAATGLNRLLLPEELGGLDAPVEDILGVVERLASADGSTAWCGTIGAGSNLFAGYLPRAGAHRVVADADQGSATMLAPAGTLTPHGGGFLLAGRWPFASNCLHSEWIGLGARLPGDCPTAAPRVAFVPTADLGIEDTWDSAGLRATGSHHVAARDLPVREDQVCVLNGEPSAGGRLWRMPIVTIYLPLLAAVQLGVARGALDEVARQAREGRSARRGGVADDPVALADLGTADMRLRAADACVREAVRDAHELAEQRRPVGRGLQARICLAAQVASDITVDAASCAHQIAGGAAYRAGCCGRWTTCTPPGSTCARPPAPPGAHPGARRLRRPLPAVRRVRRCIRPRQRGSRVVACLSSRCGWSWRPTTSPPPWPSTGTPSASASGRRTRGTAAPEWSSSTPAGPRWSWSTRPSTA
jgi:alkylation response protein AidB-like acyl-CoA dehydrogenase